LYEKSVFIILPIALALLAFGNIHIGWLHGTAQLILYDERTRITILTILVWAFAIDGIEILIRARAFSKSQLLLSKFRDDLANNPPSPDPDVTVILPAYKNPEEVGRSIHYLLKAGVPQKKILVVDDYSNDNFKTATKAASFGVKVISIGRNTQKVGAVNVGLDAVDTKFVVVLDSDCVLLASYSRLGKAIEEMEILGLDAMACRILPCPPASEAGTELQFDKRSIMLELQTLEFDQAMRLGRGSMYALQRLNGSYKLKYAEVLTIPGAFGIFRRTLLRQVMSNIKEESILAEDAERTLKILGKNGKVGYADDIVVLTAAKLDMDSHFSQRVGWSAGLFRCFVSRFGASVCKKKLAGISYLAILIREIINHPLRILSIPFLLLYPLEFVSLIGLYVAINIFIARRISVDLNVPGTILVLTVLYRLYMSIFPTTAGYFKALLHEIKLHTIDRNRKLPPIKIVQIWNFSPQPPPQRLDSLREISLQRHKEKA
jgi:cellulose synthase/poly-beta-1,6-N-acetylglucosamine synthase-like glycosyltransferase